MTDGSWVSQSPEEDAGAPTQDRFAFQHHCIARHLLASILNASPIVVICEWHEDFVIHDGGGWEAVSVKHREGAQGPFTIASLVTDGGLAKLFRTWHQSDCQARCRLMTNAALATGASGAHAVATFSERGNPHRGAVVADLSARLAAGSSEVARFLGMLAIDAELPGRRYMATQQRIDLLGPTYGALDEPAEGTQDEYWALITLIARRNADPAVLAEDHRLALATHDAEQQLRIAEAAKAARTITTDEAIALLRAARAAPHELPPTITIDAPAQTTMTRKLNAGQLSPTDLRLAIRLRNLWFTLEAEHRDTPDIEREVVALETAVIRRAGDAQRLAAEAGRPYGGKMLEVLRARLGQNPRTWPARSALVHPDALEGLAYELTDRCDVWWSPEEDVDVSEPDAA